MPLLNTPLVKLNIAIIPNTFCQVKKIDTCPNSSELNSLVYIGVVRYDMPFVTILEINSAIDAFAPCDNPLI